jgi:hypothetical protein
MQPDLAITYMHTFRKLKRRLVGVEFGINSTSNNLHHRQLFVLERSDYFRRLYSYDLDSKGCEFNPHCLAE